MNKGVMFLSFVLLSAFLISFVSANAYSGDGTYNLTTGDNVTLNNGWKISMVGGAVTGTTSKNFEFSFIYYNPQGVKQEQDPSLSDNVILNGSQVSQSFQNFWIQDNGSYARFGDYNNYLIGIQPIERSNGFQRINLISINQPILCSSLNGNLCNSNQTCPWSKQFSSPDSTSGHTCCIGTACQDTTSSSNTATTSSSNNPPVIKANCSNTFYSNGSISGEKSCLLFNNGTLSCVTTSGLINANDPGSAICPLPFTTSTSTLPRYSSDINISVINYFGDQGTISISIKPDSGPALVTPCQAQECTAINNAPILWCSDYSDYSYAAVYYQSNIYSINSNSKWF